VSLLEGALRGGSARVGQGVILHHALRLAHVERTLAEEVDALAVVRAHPELVPVGGAPNHVQVLVRLEGHDRVLDEHALPVGGGVVERGRATANLGRGHGLGDLVHADAATAPDPDLPAVADRDVDPARPLGPAPGRLHHHDRHHHEHRHELPITPGHLHSPRGIAPTLFISTLKEQSSIPYPEDFVKP